MDAVDGTTPEEVVVHRVGDPGADMAVFEFQGRLRELLIGSLRDNALSTGAFATDAKSVSPQGALSIAVAGAAAGGAAVSAAMSSTLYMATADPSTLMKLGKGVGSATMGVKGIQGQAAFLPVASSLPVVAPIMAVQVLSTAVMLQQFHQVDRKLDRIKRALDQSLARAEATHVAELVTASSLVDEVYRLHDQEGHFSTDMLVRLSLVERDVHVLAERFRYLVDSHTVDTIGDGDDIARANFDAWAALLASFLDLRIAYLRTSVDMQEHPRSVGSSVQRLKHKLRDAVEFWHALQRRSEVVRCARDDVGRTIEAMGRAERLTRGTALEKRSELLRDAYVSIMESEKAIMKGFHQLIVSSEETLEALENAQPATLSTPTLVYWQDESGEHSFCTDELRLA